MRKLLLLTMLLLPFSVFSSDLEPIAPDSACERFLDHSSQEQCFKLTREIGDSYVAALCNQQFSNDEFFNCLETAKNYTFDPKKLSACNLEETSDTERTACLKAAGIKKSTEGGLQRLPASTKSKKKKSKKKH